MRTDDPYGVRHAVRVWDAPTGREKPRRRRAEQIPTYATPKEISACLNCKRPQGACDACAGPRKSPNVSRGPEVLALTDAGKTDKEIAKILGLSRPAIVYYRKKYGIPPAHRPNPCLSCKSKSICDAYGCTCSEKARWRG